MPVSIILVFLLTGFLGAGKTTLLNALLSDDGARTTAIVNEFGDIAIDHDLVAGNDAMKVTTTGCVCCTIGSDILSTLLGLADSAPIGENPRFDRVVVGTTGLADPAPIINQLLSQEAALESVIPARQKTSPVIADSAPAIMAIGAGATALTGPHHERPRPFTDLLSQNTPSIERIIS